MANAGKKMVFVSLIAGTVIGATLGSSPSIISASLAVFGISTGVMSVSLGLLIAISFGLVFAVGLTFIGLGITGLLYESNQHPKRMRVIQIAGGFSTVFGTSGVGALIGNMIVPGIGLLIGGAIGLFFGVGTTTVITYKQKAILSQRIPLSDRGKEQERHSMATLLDSCNNRFSVAAKKAITDNSNTNSFQTENADARSDSNCELP